MKKVEKTNGILMNAQFIGQDGSCGYVAGGLYDIYISHKTSENIIVKRKDGNGVVEYSNMEKFLQNWS